MFCVSHTRFSLTCLLAVSLASLCHAQGIVGSNFTSGVAGGVPSTQSGGSSPVSVGTGTSFGGSSMGQGSSIAQGSSMGQLGIDSVSAGNGFLNQNTLGDRGFMASQGASATQGGLGGRGTQFGSFGGVGGRGGQGRGFAQPQQQRQQRIIRTRLTIPSEFVYRTVPPAEIQSKLNDQYQSVSQLVTKSRSSSTALVGLTGARITASSNGRTVVLRGQVSTARDRELAERMAKMEPGVDAVVNELIVVSR